METWSATILGEPASKSNSRRAVRIHGKPRFIKSAKALTYEKNFLLQVAQYLPPAPITGLLAAEIRIWYGSRRPDLDPSLILDILQRSGVIKNDRQVREIHSFWNLDPPNPRAYIRLTPLPENYGLPS